MSSRGSTAAGRMMKARRMTVNHLFILNHQAGRAGVHERLAADVNLLCQARRESFALRTTATRDQAEAAIREACAEGGETRVYACGGDGTYLDLNIAQKVISYRQGDHLSLKFPVIRSVCIDGEVSGTDHLDIGIRPGALRFILPKGAVWKEEVSHEAACSV